MDIMQAIIAELKALIEKMKEIIAFIIADFFPSYLTDSASDISDSGFIIFR